MTDTHPLHVISALAPLLPLGVGIVFFQRLEPARRILTLLMGLTLITQIIGLIYFIQKENNLFIYHFYMPLEFFLVGQIYKIWLKGYWKNYFIDVLIWGFVLFSILNTCLIQPLETLNSYPLFSGGILLVFFSIVYFFRTLDELKVDFIEKSPEFWINTGILLYYSGSLLILSMTHLISAEALALYYKDVWFFHSLFNILLYLLFAVGLYLKRK